MPRPDLMTRLMAKVKENPVTGCWEWTACDNGVGYGQIYVAGKMKLAHRVSYELHIGPIPEGLELDHFVCQHTKCVNPRHLEPVTHRVNVLRGNAPSAINARVTHCPRDHEYTPENTYNHPRGFRVCRECGRVAQRAYNARKRKAKK